MVSKMKVLVLVIVALAVSVSASHAQRGTPELSLESFLVVGKASGACGILNLQLTFQQTTRMAGGDEFVVRFWTTEAARLGMTLKEYSDHCNRTLASYDKLSEAAEALK